MLEHCAKLRIALLVFDFAGCGKSEGEWVSLGYKEHHDLAGIIKHMKSCYSIGPISLWGRSMGAVTAILYAERNYKEISSLILDSPFSD